MRITKKNLYKNGRCRFCYRLPEEKHKNCYHGFQDMIGNSDLNLEFEK